MCVNLLHHGCHLAAAQNSPQTTADKGIVSPRKAGRGRNEFRQNEDGAFQNAGPFPSVSAPRPEATRPNPAQKPVPEVECKPTASWFNCGGATPCPLRATAAVKPFEVTDHGSDEKDAPSKIIEMI
jgi:hypothetical protein